MPESRHGYLTINEGIHIAYQWFFLDEADRLAKTDFVATDLGKMARQEDDDSLWLLVDIAPTWSPVTGATRLGGLADVDLDIPASDGQVLGYNETYDLWQPMGVADFIGTYALDDLDDVDATTPDDGQVLAYQTSSGRWVASPQNYGFLGDGDWLYQGDENDVGQSWYVTNTWLNRIFNYGGTYLLDGADGVGTIRPLIHAGGADSDVILYQNGTGRLQTETDGVTVFGTLYADDLLVGGESVSFATHAHDDRYYTETEADSLFSPLTHSHLWVDLTDPPETATRWPAWGEVTDKPATFAPSAHNHAWSEITSGVPDSATRWPTWDEVTSKPTTFAYTDVANVFSTIQTVQGTNAQIAFKSTGTSGINQIQFWENVDTTPTFYGAIQLAGSTFGGGSDPRAGQLAVASNGDVVLAPNTQTFSPPFLVSKAAGYHTLVGQGATDAAQLSVKTDLAATRGIVVDTPASPTANLLELRNNANPVFSVTSDGSIEQTIVAASPFSVIAKTSTAHIRAMYKTYSTSGYFARIHFQKSNTNTIGVGATTLDGNYLGGLAFGGIGTSGLEDYGSAYLIGYQDGAAGVNFVPVGLQFISTAGSSGPAEVARLKHNGHLLLKTTTDLAQLTVRADATTTKGIVVDMPASTSSYFMELINNGESKFWFNQNGNWGINGKANATITLNPYGAGRYCGFSFQDAQVGEFELSGIRFNSATFGGADLRASKLELTSTSGVIISTGPANAPTVRLLINSSGQLLTSMAQATTAGTDQPAATAPYRLPIYNATGVFLGYIPIYSTWS